MANKSITYDIFGRDRTGSAAVKQVANSVDDLTDRAVAGGKRMLAATAGVVAGYAGLKTTIGAGFTRLADIEDAGASLKGLGDSQAQITSIQGSALQSVLDTSYRLNDAMTIAATASAAGVQQGKDLTRYLTIVADTAAETRSDLLSTGDALNNVITVGAAYNDSLQILAQRGLPIYSLLADKLHITTAEVKNLASQGKISADVLLDAIEGKIGGAAKALGDTTRGSIDNLGASLARTGANLQAGVFPMFKQFFSGVTDLMGPVEEGAKVVGQGIGNMASFWGGLPAPVQASVVALAAVVALRGPLASFTKAGALGFHNVTNELRFIPDAAKMARVEASNLNQEMSRGRSYMVAFSGAARNAKSSLFDAFGGGANLAVGAGIIGLTAIIAAWTQQTIAQKQAIEDLTGTLDENTGAVTQNTYSSIAKDIDDTVKSMQDLGLSTTGLATAIAQGGAPLKEFERELQAIVKDNTITNYDGTKGLNKTGTAAAQVLSVLVSKHKQVKDATDLWKRSADATAKSVDDEANSAANASYEVDDLAKKVQGAFSRADAAADTASSIDDLTSSLVENGKALDSSSAKGSADAQKLQGTIAALATQAGGDSAKFQGSVMGLMDGLRAQGVDTTKVMGIVKRSVEAVTGRKWSVLLDGSQTIAEAKRIVESNIAVVKSMFAAQSASQIGDHSEQKQAAGAKQLKALKAQLAELNSAAAEAKSVSSTFNGSYNGAVADAAKKADSGSSSKSDKATKAQRDKTRDLKDRLKEFTDVAKDGTLKSKDALDKMAKEIDKDIDKAFRQKKITKSEKTSLKSAVHDWLKDAHDAVTEAKKAGAELTSGMSDWLNPSDLESGAKDMNDKIDAALKAHSITKTVAASMKQQVANIAAADTSTEAWAKAYGVNGMVDGVAKSAREIIDGAAGAQASINAKFAQGLITKEARDNAVQSITDTVTDLQQAADDAGQALVEIASSWADSVALSDDALKRLGKLSSDASAARDAVLDAFNAGKIDANQRDWLLTYIDQQNKALYALADERQSAADALSAAQSDLDSQVSGKASWKASILDAITQLGSVTDALSAKSAQVTRTWTEMRDGKTVTFSDAIDGSLGSVDDIKKNLQDRIAATQKFQQSLSILRSEGLDDTSYKQLVDEFTSKGSSVTADALIAGGAANVKAVAGLQGQLSSAAKSLAGKAADEYYNTGISIAEGLVKGLQSQKDALDAIAADIGQGIIDTMRVAVDSHSPSRKSRKVGVDIGRGTVLGLGDGLPDIRTAAMQMADAAVPRVDTSGWSLPALNAEAADTTRNGSSSGSGSSSGGLQVTFVDKTSGTFAELVGVIVDGKLVSVSDDAAVSQW